MSFCMCACMCHQLSRNFGIF